MLTCQLVERNMKGMRIKRSIAPTLLLPFSLFIFSPTAIAAKNKNYSSSKAFHCGADPLEESQCMIRAILDDIKFTYSHTGGGGIAEIKAAATYQYKISILQEERIDSFTYEFKKENGGRLRISKRTESTTPAGN
jgi:hypothetical protein